MHPAYLCLWALRWLQSIYWNLISDYIYALAVKVNAKKHLSWAVMWPKDPKLVTHPCYTVVVARVQLFLDVILINFGCLKLLISECFLTNSFGKQSATTDILLIFETRICPNSTVVLNYCPWMRSWNKQEKHLKWMKKSSQMQIEINGWRWYICVLLIWKQAIVSFPFLDFVIVT